MKHCLLILLCILCSMTVHSQSADITLAAKVFDEILRTAWTENPNLKIMRSSVLIEKGKPADTYEIGKLWDNRSDTAWVEGVKGPGGGRPYQCNAGKSLLAVLSDGTVLPCRRLAIPIGKVPEDDFTTIFKRSSLVAGLQSKEAIPSQCTPCLFKAYCKGGLRCLAWAVTGQLQSPDPSCPLLKPII